MKTPRRNTIGAILLAGIAVIHTGQADSPGNTSQAGPPATNPPLMTTTLEDEARTVKAIASEAKVDGFDNATHARKLRERIAKLMTELKVNIRTLKAVEEAPLRNSGTNSTPAAAVRPSPSKASVTLATAAQSNQPQGSVLRQRMTDLEDSVVRLRGSVEAVVQTPPLNN